MVGLQGSLGQRLDPDLCLASSFTPCHLPSLHRERGFYSQWRLRCVLGANELKPLGPQGAFWSPFKKKERKWL